MPYNAVLVSAVKQHGPVISTHVSPLSWTISCPHLTCLGEHRAPRWAPCGLRQLPTGNLFYTWWCTCQCYPQFILPSPSLSLPCVHVFVLYICISIPAPQIGSLYYFARFHIYALIYISFSLSDLLCSV